MVEHWQFGTAGLAEPSTQETRKQSQSPDVGQPESAPQTYEIPVIGTGGQLKPGSPPKPFPPKVQSQPMSVDLH
jgi:hypothetical protein